VGYVPDGTVAVQGSRIAAAGPTAGLTTRFQAAETIDASNCAVLPGLIDTHMHTLWAVVRGVAQDVAHWMQKALASYSRHRTPQATLAGVWLNVLEALKAGMTTMVDYTHPVSGCTEIFDKVAFAPGSRPPSTRCLLARWLAGKSATSIRSMRPSARQR
jgi:5-methylthioadenosine/S-adenosylhomocysteine deaminase